jgi:hypothetical protein
VNIVRPKRSMRASGRSRLSMLSSRVPSPPQRICENDFGLKDSGKRATNNSRKAVEDIFLRTANKQRFAMDQLSEVCRKMKVGCAQRLLPMKEASSRGYCLLRGTGVHLGTIRYLPLVDPLVNTVLFCQDFLISDNHEC